MSLIKKFFGVTPSVLDIRLQLKEIDRDQIKKRRQVESLEQTKQEMVKQAVEIKKAGRQEQLREIFREMRQVEIDIGVANNDLRRISLTKTALNSFVRKAQLLESKKDHKSLQKLVSRFKDSSIQKSIDSAEVDDDTFNDMLEAILGDAEDSTAQSKAKEDTGFAEFDNAISQMAKVEGSDAGVEEFSGIPRELNQPAAKNRGDASAEGGKPIAEPRHSHSSQEAKLKTTMLGDDTGHVFHDLIERPIIWEDPGDLPDDIIKTPPEAPELPRDENKSLPVQPVLCAAEAEPQGDPLRGETKLEPIGFQVAPLTDPLVPIFIWDDPPDPPNHDSRTQSEDKPGMMAPDFPIASVKWQYTQSPGDSSVKTMGRSDDTFQFDLTNAILIWEDQGPPRDVIKTPPEAQSMPAPGMVVPDIHYAAVKLRDKHPPRGVKVRTLSLGTRDIWGPSNPLVPHFGLPPDLSHLVKDLPEDIFTPKPREGPTPYDPWSPDAPGMELPDTHVAAVKLRDERSPRGVNPKTLGIGIRSLLDGLTDGLWPSLGLPPDLSKGILKDLPEDIFTPKPWEGPTPFSPDEPGTEVPDSHVAAVKLRDERSPRGTNLKNLDLGTRGMLGDLPISIPPGMLPDPDSIKEALEKANLTDLFKDVPEKFNIPAPGTEVPDIHVAAAKWPQKPALRDPNIATMGRSDDTFQFDLTNAILIWEDQAPPKDVIKTPPEAHEMPSPGITPGTEVPDLHVAAVKLWKVYSPQGAKIKTLGAGDDTGHFFHDLINGMIIWEDHDDPPKDVIKTPPMAPELPAAPPGEPFIEPAPSDRLIADAPGRKVTGNRGPA